MSPQFVLCWLFSYMLVCPKRSSDTARPTRTKTTFARTIDTIQIMESTSFVLSRSLPTVHVFLFLVRASVCILNLFACLRACLLRRRTGKHRTNKLTSNGFIYRQCSALVTHKLPIMKNGCVSFRVIKQSCSFS